MIVGKGLKLKLNADLETTATTDTTHEVSYSNVLGNRISNVWADEIKNFHPLERGASRGL